MELEERHSQRTRSIYIDNACGLCIINMIFAVHLPNWTDYSPIPIRFYSDALFFFMFWFFFKGGVFFHAKPLKKSILQDLRRFIIPYAIFNAIGIANELIHACLTGSYNSGWWVGELYTIKDFQCCWTSMACWFLLSYFIVKVVYTSLHGRVHPMTVFLIGVALSFGLYLHKEGVANFGVLDAYLKKVPYWVGNISIGLSLFSLGHLLRNLQYNRTVLTVAILCLVIHFLYPSSIDMRANVCERGFYLPAVLSGIAGCIVLNNISRWVLDREIRVLTYVGRNSMIFYLSHYPAVVILLSYTKEYMMQFSSGIQYCLLSAYLLLVFVISIELHKFPRMRFIFGE